MNRHRSHRVAAVLGSIALTAGLLVSLPASAAPIPESAPSAATPVNGKPCTKKGAVVSQQVPNSYPRTWKCITVSGRLVWKVTSWPDFSTQPVPVDGKWLNPGLSPDLPPPMWQGEPSWYRWNWDIPTAQAVGTCPAGNKPFTTYFVNPDQLDSITPQGFAQPGVHAMPVPHMYYNTGPPTTQLTDASGTPYASEKLPVVAAAAMTLRGVATNDHTTYKEYMLSFSICGRLWLFMAHLDDLAPSIITAMKNAPRTDNGNTCRWPNNCTYIYLSVKFKAGDFIGNASGRAHGFDVGLADMSSPAVDPALPSAARLNPSAFSPRWTASRCHIKYYASKVQRDTLMSKLAGNNGCGQLVSDRKGTAAGVWLNQAFYSAMEDRHVALIRDASQAGTQEFTIGNDADVPGLAGQMGGVFMFTPTESGANRSFYKVGLGEVVCYDALQARQGGSTDVPTVYIKVTQASPTTEQLTIGTADSSTTCGSGPWTLPAQVRTFTRGTLTTR